MTMAYVDRKYKRQYCRLCGRRYTPTGSRQICCQDCRNIYNNAKSRNRNRPEEDWLPELRRKQKDRLLRAGKLKKPGEMDLNEMAAAAAAAGMSYGKYMEHLAYQAALEAREK